MTKYYILFDNHEQAIKLRRDLQNAGICSVIAPTPREASLCCGVCLRIDEQEYPALERYLKNNESTYRELKKINESFNAKRDSYLQRYLLCPRYLQITELLSPNLTI